MIEDLEGISYNDLILRAMREDHLAIQAKNDVIRLAHEGMAARLRQAAADLRAGRED